MRRIIAGLLTGILVILCLAGCGNDGKIVKRSLRDLVMADDTLVPGETLAWYMAREDFLEDDSRFFLLGIDMIFIIIQTLMTTI